MMTDTLSLLVGTYIDQRPRAEEIIRCLEGNAANPLIGDIHLFVEDPVLQWEFWFEKTTPFGQRNYFPALDTLNALRAHPKVTIVPFGRRPYYSEYFEYANRALPEGRVAIVANSDIEFDSSLSILKERNLRDIFICLSRDLGNTGHNPMLCQDSWIFQLPVKPELISSSGWPLGIGAGDHKIAYEAERAGYRLLNPGQSINATHRHDSKVRVWPSKPFIKGPGKAVPLGKIEDLDAGGAPE